MMRGASAWQRASKNSRNISSKPGWVEHDAEEIWQSALSVIKAALNKASLRPQDISGIGITNQRETLVAFEAKQAAPSTAPLVWQDRRTAECIQKTSAIKAMRRP